MIDIIEFDFIKADRLLSKVTGEKVRIEINGRNYFH